MNTFKNSDGAVIVDRMIKIIQENKQYLSDIDGAIGDGDHGINMNKGFTMTRDALDKDPGDFSHGLLTLAKILMMRIGGSMGPLYGKIFKTMGKTFAGQPEIDAKLFNEALQGVKSGMEVLSQAKVGDKTLVDVLYPAIDTFNIAIESEGGFGGALLVMKSAAENRRYGGKNWAFQPLGRTLAGGD